MKLPRLLPLAALLVFLCSPFTNLQAADDAAAKSANKLPRILFVTQSFDFKHGAVTRKGDQLSAAEKTMTDLANSSGVFQIDCTQDAVAALTKENLQNYDIVMFYTTGHRPKWPMDDESLKYVFSDWVKQKGHGFIGVHSAADTLEDYEPYWEMLGASFIVHPWTAGSTVTVKVLDPNNPITKPWGNEFTIKDEIYEFNHWQPEKVHVLMSLDLTKTDNRAALRMVRGRQGVNPFIPIAWCKEYGEGKVFHMSLGHNESVWADQRYQQSILGGIKWILGQEKADATPNPEVYVRETELGKAVLEAATNPAPSDGK
jgi:uncharacterized protein